MWHEAPILRLFFLTGLIASSAWIWHFDPDQRFKVVGALAAVLILHMVAKQPLKETNDRVARAPLILELLPLILIGKDDRNPILGDLHERYIGVWNYIVSRWRSTRAVRCVATVVASLSYLALACQVIVFAQVVDRLLKVLEAIKKIGR